MPKNAHPPRGKPAKKTAPPEEDTSFIVFGDGKPKKKKGESSGTQGDDKTKGKGAAGQAEEGPKKPDTRTLIAGASWTGKLPVNLFSEYLQKQQWGKPDYRIVGRSGCSTSCFKADLYSAKMATNISRTLSSYRRRTPRRKKSRLCPQSRSPPSSKSPPISRPPSKRATLLPHTLSSVSQARRICT
jgi:hypothetical protein